MGSNIRLSIVLPEKTTRAMRTYLKKARGRKSNVSRFVDEAVQARLFELVALDVKKRNRAFSQKQILEAIEEAIRAA